jgi:hypothetical protein
MAISCLCSGSNTDANRAYTYDANGSMTKNGNKSITWTSFNKPKPGSDAVEVNIICVIKHGLIMIFVMTLSRIVCYLFPMGCFLGCLLSLLYKDFCIT